MEDDLVDSISIPCSSLAVDSILRTSTGGIIWGSCFGPIEARKLGLSGVDRASFIAKSIGQSGLQFGLFGAIFSITNCGMERYRRKTDWVNALAAGLVAGAASGAGTRNWKQVAGMAGIICSVIHVANDSKSF